MTDFLFVKNKTTFFRHNKNIDGLRGLAALNVAVAHFISAFFPSLLHRYYPPAFSENTNASNWFVFFESPFPSVFYNGQFAVLIFFVLSGYVLTIPYYYKTDADQISLKTRIWGRFIRLNLPIFASIAIAYLFYRLNLYQNIKAADISGSINWLKNFYPENLTFSFAASSAFYKAIVLGEATFNPPLWSLRIEFMGSLYLLFVYLGRPERKTLFILLAVFFFFYQIDIENSLYYMAIFIGAALNEVKIDKRANPVLFLLGLYFGGFQYSNHIYDFLPEISQVTFNLISFEKKLFYNAAGAVSLTIAVVNGFGKHFLGSRLIQYLGKISFPLYLLHFIVLCSLSCSIYISRPPTKLNLAINLFVYLLTCFIAASVFEKMVDQPAIKVSHRFADWILGRSQKRGEMRRTFR